MKKFQKRKIINPSQFLNNEFRKKLAKLIDNPVIFKVFNYYDFENQMSIYYTYNEILKLKKSF